MLFDAPPLTERDNDVIRGIEEHRAKLQDFLRAPRRWSGQLRRNLRARAIRGSNSIEGYDVSLDDALALLEDEETIDADQRTILEIVGYRNAMTYVQQLADDEHFSLDQSLLRSLHFMMLGHDGSKSPGRYRKSSIYVRDEDADETVYEGPEYEVVEPLMRELVAALDQELNQSGQHMLVTAAMAHLNLVMIHPFRDGNGRMARGLQTLILARNMVLTPEFSSIEEWLGRNTNPYYEVLARVGGGSWNPRRSAGEWIRFNLRAHHMQAQTVWRRVLESEELWNELRSVARDERLPERVLSALYSASLGLRVRRTTYQEDADVESATAGRDLRMMTAAGLLEAHGETRGRYYLGSRRIRDVFVAVRSTRSMTLIDPYQGNEAQLGPAPRGGRRVVTMAPPE